MEPEIQTPRDDDPQAIAAPAWKKWAIIGGLTAAVAGGAGIVGAYSDDFGGFGPGRHFGTHAHWGGPGFMGRGIDGALDDIGATDEQSDKLWKILDDARAEIRPMMRDFRDTRKDLVKLLGTPTVDRAAIEKLRSERLAEIDQVSQKMTAALAEAAEVLTPQQRAKLVERFEERGSHHKW
jgi:Spy/CpxP family protein refolding chaperone